MNRLSKASEWFTQEDRAHCRGDDYLSLRSKDLSVKSGILGHGGKARGYCLQEGCAYRPALEPASLSERPSGTKLEKENTETQSKELVGFMHVLTRCHGEG